MTKQQTRKMNRRGAEYAEKKKRKDIRRDHRINRIGKEKNRGKILDRIRRRKKPET